MFSFLDFYSIGLERDRPTTWKDLVLPLVLAAVGVGLFYPFLSCPCRESAPPIVEDALTWVRSRCRTCEGQGKVSPLNRLWYGKPRADAEDSALPAPAPRP